MATDDSAFQLSDLFIDVSALPDDGYGTFQVFTLTFFYGVILFLAANLISDGSEFLLLIPSISGMVGSIVLPVLGAVPDAAIVIFSGLGSDAQYQLEVGIGALAGSTILLLTVPWFLIITAGRVDISNEGKPQYKSPKLTPPDNYNPFTTGVLVSDKAKTASIMMLVTATSYLIIEMAAIQFNSDTTTALTTDEYPYAIAAFSVAMFWFICYLVYMYMDSQTVESTENRDQYLIQGLIENKMSLVGVVGGLLNEGKGKGEGEEASLVSKNTDEAILKRIKSVLKPSFEKYDRDRSGQLDVQETTLLLRDLGESLKPAQAQKYFLEADTDKSGSIDFDEYVNFCINYTRQHPEMIKELEASKAKNAALMENAEPSKGDDEEDGEDIPEDLLSLPFEEQQRSIWFRAIWRMLLGTTLVILFSDPMVDCFTEIGDRIGVRPFYVAFVLAPIASNASEIVASFKYAAKKTTQSINISMATLLGAAIMNNTLVFGVMMIIIAVQALYFQYFAEVIAILMVEIIIASYVLLKSTHLVLDSYFILALYPLAIVVVYFLYLLNFG